MHSTIFPQVIDRVQSSGTVQGKHGRYYHLHYDLRAVPDRAHQSLQEFVRVNSPAICWSDFSRPTNVEIAPIFAQYDVSPEEIERLCDPGRCGAPMSHLSAKKLFTNGCYDSMEDMRRLFSQGIDAMVQHGINGYVELEEISLRQVLVPEAKTLELTSATPPLPFSPLSLVPLSDPVVGRDFRTTEIHVSFESLSKTCPQVLLSLLDAGFYSAFLRRENGDYKFIATIQGFDPDIAFMCGNMYGWLSRCVARGLVTSTITIKKEDIVSYALVGDAQECDLQNVIKPLSFVEQMDHSLVAA